MGSIVDVKKVAGLARLRVSASALPELEKKFAALLEHFAELAEVNTEGVEPLFHGVESMNLRADEPEAPLARELLLELAPESADDSFRLPRVVGTAE